MGEVSRSSRWPVLVLLLASLAMALTGCIGVHVGRDGVSVQPLGQSGTGAATGQQQVPLLIVQGPEGATLALVPVFINEQGPFAFALDTGASRSVVDSHLIGQLGLKIEGPAGEATGIAGSTPANNVEVSTWRMGDVKLPPRTITTIDLAQPQEGQGPQGLIGSDVLSGFGVIAIDYEHGVLTLSPRQGAAPTPTPNGSPTP
ncbi:MAG: clan AA aspartic protease [Chloroflexi bacterium]|nr:clan AA aspartic protease [Chloroflexota bacterium]